MTFARDVFDSGQLGSIVKGLLTFTKRFDLLINVMWLLGSVGFVAAGSLSPAETKQNLDVILDEEQFGDRRLPRDHKELFCDKNGLGWIVHGNSVHVKRCSQACVDSLMY